MKCHSCLEALSSYRQVLVLHPHLHNSYTRKEQCNNVHVTINCHWNKTEKTTKLRAYKIK
jgi:hypothetical protein